MTHFMTDPVELAIETLVAWGRSNATTEEYEAAKRLLRTMGTRSQTDGLLQAPVDEKLIADMERELRSPTNPENRELLYRRCRTALGSVEERRPLASTAPAERQRRRLLFTPPSPPARRIPNRNNIGMKRFSDFELDTRDWYKGVFESRAERMAELADRECQIPPTGWWCSREIGHGGPCTARPEIPPKVAPQHYRRMWHRCGWYATTRCMINRGYTKEQFRLIFPREGFPT